jgi:hypothetical protein
MWQTTTTHTTLSWRGMRNTEAMQTYAWLSMQVTTHVRRVSNMKAKHTDITIWASNAKDVEINVRPYSAGPEVILDVCGVEFWLSVDQAKELSDKLDSTIADIDHARLQSLKEAHEQYERLAQN